MSPEAQDQEEQGAEIPGLQATAPNARGDDAPEPGQDGSPETARQTTALRGLVVDLDGAPWRSGAHVFVTRGERSTELAHADSDSNGEFVLQIPGRRETAWLSLRAEAMENGSHLVARPRMLSLDAGHPPPHILLVLAPAVRVSGRVIGASGDPVPHAEVLCRTEPSYQPVKPWEVDGQCVTHKTVRADADGRFRFAARPRVALQLRARSRGGFGAPVKLETPPEGDLDAGDLRELSETVAVRLVVADASGEPVTGAWACTGYGDSYLVSAGIARSGGWEGDTLTDGPLSAVYLRAGADGVLDFGTVSTGALPLVLAVGSPRHVTQSVRIAKGGSGRRTITLRDRMSIDVVLLQAGESLSSPPPGSRVSLRAHTAIGRRPSEAVERLHDDLGRGTVIDVAGPGTGMRAFVDAPGEYSVQVRLPGGRRVTRRFRMPEDRGARLTLEIPPGRVVRIRPKFLGWDAELPALRPLSVLSLTGESGAGETKRQWRHRLEVEAGGSVSVWVPTSVQLLHYRGLVRTHAPRMEAVVRLAPDLTAVDLPIRLDGAGLVRVHALIPDGRAVGGVPVVVRAIGSPEANSRATRTGPDGSAALLLPAGAYAASISPRLAPVEWVRFDVVAGEETRVELSHRVGR